jgi:hypothetical protein
MREMWGETETPIEMNTHETMGEERRRERVTQWKFL